MGSGSWDTRSFVSYSTSKGYGTDSRGVVTGSYSNQEMFKAKNIDAALDPKGVIRECCDNEEHPNTLPVILALDVTGSMGQTAVEIAKRLNEIIFVKRLLTELYPNASFSMVSDTYDYWNMIDNILPACKKKKSCSIMANFWSVQIPEIW